MELTKIFFVVVLYKTTLENSKTVETLSAALTDQVELLVYDNSPVKQYKSAHFKSGKFEISYLHDAANSGLSKAYNVALDLAAKRNCSWILLLDQDTTFNKDYLNEISALKEENLLDNIVAIMPNVVASVNEVKISPSTMGLGGFTAHKKKYAGTVLDKITGINSGTMLKVNYMVSIDGFDQRYSLDMLDHSYFRQIYANYKQVYVLNSTIHQDLSVFSSLEKSMSVERYSQLLDAEYLFSRDVNLSDVFVFKIRLCARLLKQLSYTNKKYAMITVKKVFKIHK